MNGKYGPLYKHIRRLDERGVREWHTTFAEIVRILGKNLPPSAREHRQWWENQRSGKRSQRDAWMSQGWETRSVNFTKETVSFERKG